MHATPNDSHPSGSKKLSPRRIGLTRRAEICLKQRLRKKCPSEPWVEAQIKTANDVGSDGQPIVYRYHDTHVFPPGGAKTKMIRCPKCGVFNPPNAIESGACLDHASHEGWGPSPSAVAIGRLQFYKLRGADAELPPEDLDSLRQEIEQYPSKKLVHPPQVAHPIEVINKIA